MEKTIEEQESLSDSRFLSGQKLAKLGVQIRNRFDAALECMTCGAQWTPHRLPDGRLAPGYWKCPNRCNW